MRNIHRLSIIFSTALSCLFLGGTLHAAEFTYTESDDSGSNIALGYAPPEPQATTDAGAWFREYDYMHAVHQALALDHDFITAHVVGQTWSGEDIWAYRFGDADDVTVHGDPEGSVLINGGIHAREWQVQEATTGLMEYLAANATDGDIVQYLIENLNIVIIPVHNIDGFRQTQAYWNKVTQSEQQPRDGRMRRKNLHAPGDVTVDDSLQTTGDNLYGIDLNRNTAHGFGANGGSSNDFTSLVYRGTTPDSEPETQALKTAISLAPNLRFYEDTHSYSQLMYVPQTGDEERDRQARELAQLMSNAVGGRYDVSPDPINGYIGTTSDYFAYEYGVPSWTLELEPRYFLAGTQYGGVGVSHDGFILPAAEVPRLKDEYNAMHVNTFYDRAGPAWLEEVQIRETASGSLVYSARWEPNGTERQLAVTVDEPLEAGVEYSLWLGFSKPMIIPGFDNNHELSFSLVSVDDGTEQAVNTTSAGEWLTQAGGAPDGYASYSADAYRTDFIFNADSIETGRWMLALTVYDGAGNWIDAEPTTPIGFADGAWVSYERYPRPEAGDPVRGGYLECNHGLRIGTGSSTQSFDRGACRDYIMVVDADAEPDPPSTGGGGGGNIAWLLLALALSGFSGTRRRMP